MELNCEANGKVSILLCCPHCWRHQWAPSPPPLTSPSAGVLSMSRSSCSSINLRKSWNCYSALCSSPSRPQWHGVFSLSMVITKARLGAEWWILGKIPTFTLTSVPKWNFLLQLMILYETSSSNPDILTGQSDIKEAAVISESCQFKFVCKTWKQCAIHFIHTIFQPVGIASSLSKKSLPCFVRIFCNDCPGDIVRGRGSRGCGLLVLVPLPVFQSDLHLH